MGNNENMLDYIYDKKAEDELFTLDDSELKRLQQKITIADKEITQYIEKRVHPKSRKQLRRLFINYSNAIFISTARENQLYYRYGLGDGVKFLMDSLSAK